MGDKTYKDVHFIPSENDDFFDVEEKILFNFFSFRTFKSKTGEPFSIRNIYGHYNLYYNKNLDLVDLISVIFVYYNSDHDPFVLILEKSNRTRKYYRMLSYSDNRWNPINELNGIPKHIQQKRLLNVLKVVFSKFFEWEIVLKESKIKNRSGVVISSRHKIISEINHCEGYDRHFLKPRMPVSVSTIIINDDKMEIEKNLKFIEHFYFYYVHDEYTTPLMMETVDYQIGGSLPVINYFIPGSLGNKWVPAYYGAELLEPKYTSDIKMILDGVVNMYRNHPVAIDIKRREFGSEFKNLVRFSRIYFGIVYEKGEYYKSHTFKSKVTKSFFIKHIMFDEVKQEIDIQNTEVESITVYYKVDQPHMPLLICLKLYNKTYNSVEKFKWFYIPRFDKNVWLKLDFEGHPDNDKILIEQKIKLMYASRFNIGYIIIPLKWMGVFVLISTMLTLLLKQRRRLRLILMGLYNHIIL